jgi:hypothetical protein
VVPDSSDVDRIRKWVARNGRRNIAYVVFVSLLVPFATLLQAAGPQGPHAGGGIMAQNLVERGLVDLLYGQWGTSDRSPHQRPAGSKAPNRMCPAAPLHGRPLALGALLRAVRTPRRDMLWPAKKMFAAVSGSEGEG